MKAKEKEIVEESSDQEGGGEIQMSSSFVGAHFDWNTLLKLIPEEDMQSFASFCDRMASNEERVGISTTSKKKAKNKKKKKGGKGEKKGFQILHST